MEPWNAPYQPAPEFERQQINEAPAEVYREVPDLEAMAITLDRMKIEAAIDSEHARPSLNGLFAFLLTGGVVILGLYVVQYGPQALHMLAQGAHVNFGMILLAGLAGVLAGFVVALLSVRATRRTQRAVRTYEQRLLELGGAPLPERGQRFDKQR